jgi:Na+-transporting NADH:ubiquinone oxidoreductase subunit NqrD
MGVNLLRILVIIVDQFLISFLFAVQENESKIVILVAYHSVP